MLRLALVNLVSNALKFTRGRPLADIEIGCLPSQGAETVVFIRDNSVGFDLAYAENSLACFSGYTGPMNLKAPGSAWRTCGGSSTSTGGEGAVDQGATFYFSLPQVRKEYQT